MVLSDAMKVTELPARAHRAGGQPALQRGGARGAAPARALPLACSTAWSWSRTRSPTGMAAGPGLQDLRRALGQGRLVRHHAQGRRHRHERVLAGTEDHLRAGRLRTRHEPPETTASREEVFAVIDAAFAQRRKTLRAALAGWAGSPAAGRGRAAWPPAWTRSARGEVSTSPSSPAIAEAKAARREARQPHDPTAVTARAPGKDQRSLQGRAAAARRLPRRGQRLPGRLAVRGRRGHGAGTTRTSPSPLQRRIPPRSRIAESFPLGPDNLVVKAATAAGANTPGTTPASICASPSACPIAGGMGGGSADAAATLVACNALWDTGLNREELSRLGAAPGRGRALRPARRRRRRAGRGRPAAPLLLRTRTALGAGPGLLRPVHPAVYGMLDALRGQRGRRRPPSRGRSRDPRRPCGRGCSMRWQPLLVNDLQPRRPGPGPGTGRGPATVGEAAGALAALVSGSGPTLAFLARRRRTTPQQIIEPALGRGGRGNALAGPRPGPRRAVILPVRHRIPVTESSTDRGTPAWRRKLSHLLRHPHRP